MIINKKKGSSLILVLIICMCLSTVSMAMISMISTNYKLRVIENDRAENLYSSESGLDVVYNIIGKTFDAAVNYGNLKVEELKKGDSSNNKHSYYNNDYVNIKNDIEYWKNYNKNHPNDSKNQNEINKNIKADKEFMEVIINEEFKRSFNNFIVDNQDSIKGNNETLPNKLKESIEDGSYVNKINTINDYDEVIVQFPDMENRPVLSVEDDEIKYSFENQKSQNLRLANGGEVKIIVFKDSKFTIKVDSEFTTKNDDKNGVIGNKRKVQTSYTLKVPEYKDIYYSSSQGELDEYVAIKDKALTIGGDMSVDNVKNFEVNGDIFILGTSPKSTPQSQDKAGNSAFRVYEKYMGGINLKNSGNVIFNNDVITRNTFNIESEVKSNIKGNLYARNLYAGNIDKQKNVNNILAYNSNLNTENEVVLDNDLTLKALNTHITIKDFYGINDKNIKYSDGNNNSVLSDDEKRKTSSSIIINGYKENENNKSSIDITDTAYIMGVASINAAEEYMTGESTGVKGNYRAYTEPLNDSEVFKYNNPLQLLDESDVFKKSQHFTDYWANKDNIDNGGIKLPEHTYSVGATVDVNGVKGSTYKLGDQNIINKKRQEYAKKVYNFGETLSDGYLNELYNNPDKAKYSIDNIFELSENFNEENYNINEEIKKSEKAIISNATIIIKGNNASHSYDNGEYIDSNKYIVIDASNEKEIHAVIATSKDVIIDGDVEFRGNIITKGNLSIKGLSKNTTKSKIIYDKEVIDRIQIEHSEIFSKIFGNVECSLSNKEIENSNYDSIEIPKYDLKKFINTNLWKIIK